MSGLIASARSLFRFIGNNNIFKIYNILDEYLLFNNIHIVSTWC